MSLDCLIKSIARRNIYVPFWFFPMQIDMETKKQTKNLLMLNAIIPKACKKWPRNGKSQVFKKLYYWLLISFDFWILRLSILKVLLALTLQLQQPKHYIFHLQFYPVNILVLLFWDLCVLDKMRHCFLNLKGHLKIIKNYNHYCSSYQCYYKWHFYHYFRIVHCRWINWITWTYTHSIFPFPFDSESSYGKTKII